MAETDINLSVILVGDSSVGKTSLLIRFVDNKFGDTQATVGIDYMRKVVCFEDQKILVRFWDTAGTEKYSAMADSAFKNAAGALLVYDVSKRESFSNLRLWLLKIKEKSQPNIKIMLIGTKIDLIEQREVSREEGSRFAAENGLFFTECSAKTNENGQVEDAFITLVMETYSDQKEAHLARTMIPPPKLPARVLAPSNLHADSGSGCC